MVTKRSDDVVETLSNLARSAIVVPRLALTVVREDGKPSDRRAILDGESLRIGSHPSNDLVVADARVSRFHLEVSRGTDAWRIVDVGSKNGTSLDGIRVRDAELRMPECEIQLGDSIVRVREMPPVGSVSLGKQQHFGSIRGRSLAMQKLFTVLERVSKSDANVLIEGESGTGKELVASEIVRHGARASSPFVVVDCGSISPTLIESELFGHARGAFTGADRERPGVFEAAAGGTVFLDEIGEMPIDMQPKLLRALESREVRRVGETKARKIDVRVLAATNRKLAREVNSGRFREDLYFRLSVVTIRVPSLRERMEDLPILIDAFVESLDATDKRAKLFTREVVAEMIMRDWPGNVRELRNFIERAIVLEDTRADPDADIGGGPDSRKEGGEHGPIDLDVPFRAAKDRLVEGFERRYLTALLAWAGGNVSRAARRARMDRMNLHRLVQIYGLKASRSVED